MQQMKKVGRLLLSGRVVSERCATCHLELGTALHLSERWQVCLKAMNHSSLIQSICPIRQLNPLTFHLGGGISLPDASKKYMTTKMINVPFPATLIQPKPTKGICRSGNNSTHNIVSIQPQ